MIAILGTTSMSIPQWHFCSIFLEERQSQTINNRQKKDDYGCGLSNFLIASVAIVPEHA